MEAYVTAEHFAEGIATITFFHPAQNSMPSVLLQRLAATISEVGEDERTKVIVLKSGGERTFCGGAIFEELASIETEEQGLAFFSGFANVINACRQSSAIVIGRVQGKAAVSYTHLDVYKRQV